MITTAMLTSVLLTTAMLTIGMPDYQSGTGLRKTNDAGIDPVQVPE
jgi:hypothetical protein